MSQPQRKLGNQAVLGAIDQALLAAAHFALGIVVARMGGPLALGTFAFAYAIIVLVNMLHSAVLAEVYSIDPDADLDSQCHGATPILIVTAGLYLACASLIALLAVGLPELRAATSNASFHCALLSSTVYWSAKPYFYRHGQPMSVLLATGIYALATLASALAFFHVEGAHAQPLWAIGIGGALASIPLLRKLRRPDANCVGRLHRYLRVSIDHARWAVPAALLIWINSNGYVFLMPMHGQTEQTGGLRAIVNLVAPVNTLLVGACAALLPALAQLHRRVEPAVYARTVHMLAAVALGLAVATALAIAPFSERLIVLVYGEAYAPYAGALRVAILLPALWAVASVYRAAIRAQANALDLFKVYAIALFPVGLALLIWLSRYGATAALQGMLATQALVVTGFLYRFSRLMRRPRS
jgi:O-antigen/teichoic acid export membrane protein